MLNDSDLYYLTGTADWKERYGGGSNGDHIREENIGMIPYVPLSLLPLYLPTENQLKFPSFV